MVNNFLEKNIQKNFSIKNLNIPLRRFLKE